MTTFQFIIYSTLEQGYSICFDVIQNVQFERLITCNSYSVKQETRFRKCVIHFVNFGTNPCEKLFSNTSMANAITRSECTVVTRLLDSSVS